MIYIVQHKEQRVGVFVDVQNLYYSAKNLYQRKVNFKEILTESVKGRRLIRAFAYVIKADMKDEKSFHEALQSIGFDVKSKDIQIFHGGNKKGDWDVGIAMDAVRMAPKLDTVVLVSGDGDFQDLIEYLKAHGCRAEVLAFKSSCSSRLLDVVDHFTDMSINAQRFLERSTMKGNKPQNKTQSSSKKTSQKKSAQKNVQRYKQDTKDPQKEERQDISVAESNQAQSSKSMHTAQTSFSEQKVSEQKAEKNVSSKRSEAELKPGYDDDEFLSEIKKSFSVGKDIGHSSQSAAQPKSKIKKASKKKTAAKKTEQKDAADNPQPKGLRKLVERFIPRQNDDEKESKQG